MSYELLFHNLSDASGYGLCIWVEPHLCLELCSVAAVRYLVAATTGIFFFFLVTRKHGKVLNF